MITPKAPIYINAEMARQLLEDNRGDNRRISARRVEQYAKDMVAGKWELTHQGIAIDDQGHLMDGQHRMYAVIAADKAAPGISVPFIMFRDVPNDAFWMLDSGMARNATSFMQGPYANYRVAMARLILRIKEREGKVQLSDMGNLTYTSHAIMEFMDANPDIAEFGEKYSHVASKASYSHKISGTTATGLLVGGWIAGLKSPERGEQWWQDVESLRLSAGLENGNPLRALANVTNVDYNAMRFSNFRAIWAGAKYQRGEIAKRIIIRNDVTVKCW